MAKKKIFCIIMAFCISPVMAQKNSSSEKLLLSDLMKEPAKYTGKQVILVLKLKNRDTVFEKIVFYDSRNADIEFDISDRHTKKRLAKALLNLHEGLDYRVRFVVKSIDPVSGVAGEILSFDPVIIEKLP